MGKCLFNIIVCFSWILSFGQDKSIVAIDTLNKLDSQGKRTGYWVELLAEDLKIVRNEKKAAYLRYVYFQNGIRYDALLVNKKPRFCTLHIDNQVNIANQESITLLNGEYFLYGKKRKLIKQFEFTNGILIKYIEFFNNGKVRLEIFYERKYENYFLSYFFTAYDEDGRIGMSGFYLFNDGKWRYIKM